MSLKTVLVNLYDGKRFIGSNVFVYDQKEIPVDCMLFEVLEYIKRNPRDLFNHLVVYECVNSHDASHIKVFGKDDVDHCEHDAPKFIISLVFFGESDQLAKGVVGVLRKKIDQTMMECAAEAERKSAEIHQQKMKLQQLERFKTYLQLKAEFES